MKTFLCEQTSISDVAVHEHAEQYLVLSERARDQWIQYFQINMEK